MSIRYYINRLDREWRLRHFERALPAVLKTPPAVFTGVGVLVVSMVQHRDVLPYLLAIKSFAARVPVVGVVVVADPTLSNQDRALLVQHLPALQVRESVDFQLDGLPTGGTWERLCAITQYAQTHYVVQLDADTVSFGSMAAVKACVQNQQPFSIGTYDLQAPVAVSEVARWARSHVDAHKEPHIQLVSEANLLAGAGGNAQRVYIRGCSGFTGWAPGCVSTSDLVAFSTRMRAAVGMAWDKWGTEQFASNYMLANAPGAVVLPHPVYTTPDLINHTTEFVHFIGPLRYNKGLYLKHLQQFLQEQGVNP